jgi:uncharacterized Zn-finger protein
MSDHGEPRLTSGTSVKHERTETGVKPYECDVCKKKFRRSDHLASHRRTHTWDKPYECDVCRKKFRRSGSWQDIKKHTLETTLMNVISMFVRKNL